jgi:hypothetical protein
MAATAETLPLTPPAAALSGAARLPWYLTAVLFASTAILVGLIWDICWHRSIGRDTFWSPPHLAIYLGGVVAGLASAAVILRTTLRGSAEERAGGVRVLGFTGPLGAFFCSWGAGAMLTSAPFDDWWHNTYGLDVKIISPPHMVLALGIGAIQVGAMITAVALQNRREAAGEDAARPDGLRSRLRLSYVVAAGLLLMNVALLAYEYAQRVLMHSSIFYQVCGGAFPLVLVAAARASRLRWPATIAAGIYTALWLVLVWIMPLFPAEPRLGPVRQPITHMVPLQFPLLLIVPALAIDLIRRHWKGGRGWTLALALGAGFLVAFLAAQWPFGNFLLSPASRNWVFATHELPYFVSPAAASARNHFFAWDRDTGALLRGLLLALGLAVVSARLGLAWGGWMSRVRR